MANDKEILTIEEAAEYLRIRKRSIYKLDHSGKLPHKKVLNKYRFVKRDLRKWVQGDISKGFNLQMKHISRFQVQELVSQRKPYHHVEVYVKESRPTFHVSASIHNLSEVFRVNLLPHIDFSGGLK